MEGWQLPDQEKIGTTWTDDELDAIIRDYFAMLNAELSGRPYLKSHHSTALMKRIGRTHRSVEFKHQNISAVLEELALPWIPGYKPNTTLADLLTTLFAADPFSAVWASLGWWPSDELEDGVAYGWQGWLRRRPGDSFFFPALLF